MQEEEHFLLFKYLPEMKRLLDTDNIYLYLRAENSLSDNDLSEFKQAKTENHDRAVCRLAELVYQRGERCLERFLKALRRSATDEGNPGHIELLGILKPRCSTPQDTDPQPPEFIAEPTVTMETSDTVEQSGQIEVLGPARSDEGQLPTPPADVNDEIEEKTSVESQKAAIVCFIP